MIYTWVFLSLAWLTYFGIHSLLADDRIKSWFYSRLGKNRVYYRLGYNVLAVLLLGPLVYLQHLLPDRPLAEGGISPQAEMLGGMSIVAGLVVGGLALGRYDLGEFSGLRQIKDQDEESATPLVVSGWNRWVRHPLYFALLLILAGYLLVGPSHQRLIIVIICCLYLYVGARLEERKLVRRYGAAYEDYQRRVSMLIPFIL